MIAVSSKSRSFESLGKYLVTAKDGDERDRVAWSASRNLPTDDPELAAKIMRGTAAQNVRVGQPVYHLTISFDPGDPVDRAAMERIADRVIATLGLQEHQVLIVSHADRDHPHMHLLINRVHPETGKVWSQWQDYDAIQRVLRDEEKALGLREVPGTLGRQLALDFPGEQANGDAHGPTVKELAEELRKYERAIESGPGRYSADMETAAAQARLAQLDAAIERANKTREAFDKALAAVYRDPDGARKAFETAAERDLSGATRTMRSEPERYGELATTARRGLAGRIKHDDTVARSAARAAAAAGKDAVEADRALRTLVGAPLQLTATSLDGERSAAAAFADRARTQARALAEGVVHTPGQYLMRRALALGLRQLQPIFHLRARRRSAGRDVQLPGPHTARAAGELGGAAGAQRRPVHALGAAP